MLEYAPGKTVVVVDALSRAYLPNRSLEIPEIEMKYHMHSIMRQLPMSKTKLMEYKEAIGKDEALQAVCKYVKEGWPDALKDVCKIAKPYYSVKDQLTMIDELIFMLDRLMFPPLYKKKHWTVSIMDIREMKHNAHDGDELLIS